MQCCRDHRKAEKTFEQRSESVIVHLETATHRSGEQNSSECTISTNSPLCSSISRPALPPCRQKSPPTKTSRMLHTLPTNVPAALVSSILTMLRIGWR